jgi:DNA-binding NarL/FixJ family response regulator
MPSLVFLERDEQLRRRLVRLLTATLPEFSPIGQALDSEQLLCLCRSGPWDVAIVDLLTLTDNAIALVQRLHEACPSLAIVAISFSLELDRIAALLSHGLNGLVATEDVLDELAAAARSALADEQYLSRAMRRAYPSMLPDEADFVQ